MLSIVPDKPLLICMQEGKNGRLRPKRPFQKNGGQKCRTLKNQGWTAETAIRMGGVSVSFMRHPESKRVKPTKAATSKDHLRLSPKDQRYFREIKEKETYGMGELVSPGQLGPALDQAY